MNPAVDPDLRVYLHWHSPEGVRVPDTAVEADPDRQSPATVHVTHYFDSRRTCEGCGRPFLFFADEQRFWYEELGFPLEADAVRCVPCRRETRGLERTRSRYEELSRAERGPEEELELAECLLELVTSGGFGFRAREKLRALVKRLPAGPRAEALASRVVDLGGPS